MENFESQYKSLLNKAVNGFKKQNRTGVDTYSVFNASMTIDLDEGFPVLTSKQVFFDKGLSEFNWMIEGRIDVGYLNKRGVHWWNEYADENGNLEHSYGAQFRRFGGYVDQVEIATREISKNSRRAHITLWDPTTAYDISIPPCYTGFTFVRYGDNLNMNMNLRSSDLFLGLPYDIIVGALLLMYIADKTNLKPKLLGVSIADAHVYVNHMKAIATYMSRGSFKLPNIIKTDNTYKLINYKHHGYIKAKMNN